MEPSEEIRRVIARWTKAIEAGDGDAFLGRLSGDAGTSMIGTDPAEFWIGGESRALWAQQMQETGGFPVTATEIHAWEEGTVGWAALKESIDWEGQTIESRATYILHLEHGEWKVVHVHWSFPRANDETLGRSLTVSLDELDRTLQRDQPDLSASLAVDGTVTIVFTDIVDSTVMLARLGDRAWLEVIRRHNAVIEQVTAAHGGTVIETQGDGSMLAFSSARRAVLCAQAIQQEIDRAFAELSPPIRVRIGIHTGDAIREAEQFFGTTVHYAARVASHATGGEVLVSSAVHELLVSSTPDLAFLDGRDVDLKGIAGRHRLYALAPA
jgi:class 3 adenylate cyclase/ketosteroid isomerase-like protein